MNSKNTRRALLSSVVAMLVCFTMLLSTTFAWFTDTAVSGSNIIKSGKLEVALLDKAGASLEGEIIEWAAEDGRAQDQILWEPGCTYETEPFYVVNEGNLALKYQVVINGIDGDAKLLEAIEWTLTVDGVETDLFAFEGKLYPTDGSNKTGAIVLSGHMKEDVGNEYQGKTIEGISVSVFATQLTSESDSFGPNYDGGAVWIGALDYDWYVEDPDATEFVIGSAEDLAAFAAIVNGTAVYDEATTYAATSEPITLSDDFGGKTIKLDSNIDLGNAEWTPIGTEKTPFKGTFDGQGYTVYNLKINAPEMAEVGLFGRAVNADIKNVTVENADIRGYQEVAAIVGAPYSGCSVSNCHVRGDINLVAEFAYVGGIAAYGYVDIDNCSVIPDGRGTLTSIEKNAVGGIMAWLLENNNSITNCRVENLDLTGWANIGSIAGFVHYNDVVDNCYAENITLTKTRVGANPSIGALCGGWCYGEGKTITISNNTIKNVVMNGNAKEYDFADKIYFGSEYYGKTTGNFVSTNNTFDGIEYNVVVGAFVSDATALQNELTNGGTVVLNADVKMESATTAPYGNKYAVKMDGGVLDGNGNELYMECYGDDYGVMISSGTIKNLTITEGCRAVMIMYPQGDVTLDNVNIGGDGVLYPINTGEAGVAGVKLTVTNSTLAGWTSYGNVESASFTNVKFEQGTYYNNIYGRVLKPYVNTTLTNCDFVEHMNLDLSALTNGHKITITNCTVNGVALTAGNMTTPSADSDYDTALFTVDLPSWATSINDCIIFN